MNTRKTKKLVTLGMLWNYWIAPLYMGVSRAEIVPLLFTAFGLLM